MRRSTVITEKKIWLDKLYYKIGRQWTDFSLTYTIKKKDNIYFNKWRTYLDAQADDVFIKKCNQRTLLKNEVVLEYDGDWNGYLNVITALKQLNAELYAYSTEDKRAKHIHLFFGIDFAMLKRNEREAYRMALIDKYNCDPALKSERHMIALENCPHWKTGKIKRKIEIG